MKEFMLLLAGAAVGLVSSLIADERKRRDEFSRRWDPLLVERATALTAEARRLWSIAARLIPGSAEPCADADRPALLAALELARESVRVESEKLRLLGSSEVGRAGRELRRAAFQAAARSHEASAQAEAGRDDDEVRAAASMKAVTLAITSVHEAVRKQLRIKGDVGDDWV